MTLVELIDAYRVEADDRQIPYLTSDEDVIRYLNEGESEACIRAKLIFDTDPGLCEIHVGAGDPVVSIDPLINEISYASLMSADGTVFVLNPTDRLAMDRDRPDWRTYSRRPDGYIHDDKSLTLNSPVDADYTLNLEVYRCPARLMSGDGDTPDIAAIHHRHLLDWAMFRAYSNPDAELFNPKKSEQAEARFERYFGAKPDASIRRKQNANRPHRNACW